MNESLLFQDVVIACVEGTLRSGDACASRCEENRGEIGEYNLGFLHVVSQ